MIQHETKMELVLNTSTSFKSHHTIQPN